LYAINGVQGGAVLVVSIHPVLRRDVSEALVDEILLTAHHDGNSRVKVGGAVLCFAQGKVFGVFHGFDPSFVVRSSSQPKAIVRQSACDKGSGGT
jgi:hypothetical protein